MGEPSPCPSRQRGAMVGVELVELVPDLDQLVRRAGDAEFAEDRLDVLAPARRVSAWAMSRTWTMTSAARTSSSVARNAEISMVGRSEMKPTVSERIAAPPCGSFISRIVGSSVANSMSAATTSARVRRLNSVDLPALV